MRDANDGTLAVLFDELEIKLGIYNADIITDNYADLILVDKIKMVGKRAVQGEELQLLEHLVQTLGDKAEYAQNRQFVECMRDIALYLDEKITAEQYQERLKYTLSYTISECCADNTKHFLTRVEFMLMYYTAILSRKSGNSEKGMEIVNEEQKKGKYGLSLYRAMADWLCSINLVSVCCFLRIFLYELRHV